METSKWEDDNVDVDIFKFVQLCVTQFNIPTVVLSKVIQV